MKSRIRKKSRNIPWFWFRCGRQARRSRWRGRRRGIHRRRGWRGESQAEPISRSDPIFRSLPRLIAARIHRTSRTNSPSSFSFNSRSSWLSRFGIQHLRSRPNGNAGNADAIKFSWPFSIQSKVKTEGISQPPSFCVICGLQFASSV